MKKKTKKKAKKAAKKKATKKAKTDGPKTLKQQMFIKEFLIDLNGTQAAIRAGYSKKTANQIAAENLAKPVISHAIAVAIDERSKRTQLTADEVLEEYARIGRSDITDYLEFGPSGVTLKPSDDLEDGKSRAIREVSETINAKGESQIKLKLHDKLKALENAGRHLGISIERKEHTGKDGGPIEVKSALPKPTKDVMRLAAEIITQSDNDDD